MEEVAPGVYKVPIEETVEEGPKLHVNYMQSSVKVPIGKPIDVLRELNTYSESKVKSLCVAILSEDWDRLEQVFWFQGRQKFPKEDLELAADGKGVVLFFFNHANPETGQYIDKDTGNTLLGYMLPRDTISYTVADLITIDNKYWKSLMCNGCCPSEGMPID